MIQVTKKIFGEKFYQHIWCFRCELVNEWEERNSISQETKREKKNKQLSKKADQENLKRKTQKKIPEKKKMSEEAEARRKKARILASSNITNLIEQGTKPLWSSWVKPKSSHSKIQEKAELTRPAAACQGSRECLQ